MKYYVVLVGKVPGIYKTWSETQKQVLKYPGAIYKSFNTLEEAEQYQQEYKNPKPVESKCDECYLAYTDGSYSRKEDNCGYGIVIITPNKNKLIGIYGNIDSDKKTNNVGELYAINRLLDEKYIDKLMINTDSRYSIQAITTVINNKTMNSELIRSIQEKLKHKEYYEIVHVKAHADNKLNNMADQLANQGRLSNKEYNRIEYDIELI